MPAKAGQIVIDISAGTSQFIRDMESAKGSVRTFGHEAKATFSPTYAIKGLKDVAEGRYKFAFAELVDQMIRLRGTALAVGGGVAGVAALGAAVYLVIDHMKQLADLPGKIAAEFRKLNSPLQETNDELRVANDRLDDDIAKLEGRRQNTLKLALDDAVVSADKLAKSLDDDLDKLNKLLKQDNVSFWRKMLGEAGNSDVQKEFADFQAEVGTITSEGNAAIRAATNKKDQDTARAALKQQLGDAYDSEVKKIHGLISAGDELQRKRDSWDAAEHMRMGMPNESRPGDQTARLGDLRGGLAQLQLEQGDISLQYDNADLAGKKAGLSGDKSAKEAADAAAKKAAETLVQLGNQLAEAKEAQANELDRINIAENQEIQNLAAEGQINRDTLALVRERYDTKYLTAYADIAQKYATMQLEWAEKLRAVTKDTYATQFAPGIAEAVKNFEAGAKAAEEWAKSYNKITADTASESLRHRVAMAGAGANPNDPMGTLAAQQAIERAQIEATYEEKLKLAVNDLDKSVALRERDLELAKLEDQYEEQAAAHRHKNLQDFMFEAQAGAKTFGDILYSGANDALNKVSDDLANLMTHPEKGGVAKMFGDSLKDIGTSMSKEGIKSMLTTGLGALGKKLGIHGPSGKPDGTQGNPYHVVLADTGAPKNQLNGIVPGLPPAFGSAAATGVGGFFKKIFGGASSGGGIEDVTSSISFPGMAAGGNADPGKIYRVAEAGEGEFITPKNASTVTPMSKLLGRGGGASHVEYNIDARNADLGAENRVQRAIEHAHDAAVSNGVRAASERAKRTPQRSNG